MGRRATLVNSLTKGVLDPALTERIDLAHYYNGLAEGKNAVVVPQGGLRRRPGSRLVSDADVLAAGYRRRLRRRIAPINVTTAMITTFNGGTPANLLDQSTATVFTTSGPAGGGTFVVFEIDLGAATEVVFFDVIEFYCGASKADDVLAVQFWDGAVWQTLTGSNDPSLSPYRNIRTSSLKRSRRFGEWPGGPGGSMVSSRFWRLVLVNPPSGLSSINVSGIRLWTEKRQLSPVKMITFARSRELTYELVLSDRNVDVFRNHRYVASVAVPIAAEQVREVNIEQSLDTLFLFHEDITTPVIERQGAHDEWNVASAVYTNMPQLTASTAFGGSADEVQDLVLGDIVSGDLLVIWREDIVSAPISYGGTGTLAALVQAALGAMPGVIAPGPTVTLLPGSLPGVRIQWSGNNGSRRQPVAFASGLVKDIKAETAVVERGLNGTGLLAAADTGFPRCGALFQSRLVLAGFRAAPQTLAFSVLGSFYSFDRSGTLTADKAVVITLDTDQIETIHEVYVGRHLQFFTESGEWYVETRTIDATQPVNVLLATRYGLKSSVPLTFADGATLFIQKGGQTLRDFLFSDVEQSYKAEPLSLLAPHLLTDVVDVAFRSAQSTSEGNQIFMINGDGSIALLTLLRTQEVVATMLIDTDGAYRAGAGDILSNIWLVVERETVAGGADLYLEKTDTSLFLDCVTEITGAASNTITALAIYEGKAVWVVADDELVGPLTVTGASVTLPAPAAHKIVGLFAECSGRLPTPREKLQNGYPFHPPARVYEMELALEATGYLEISANGGAFREVPLTHLSATRQDAGWNAAGGEIDKPMMQRLFTGYVRMENFRGWLRHPTIAFRQSRPAPLFLKALRYELSHHG